MGQIWRLLRIAKAEARHAVAFMLVALLAWCSAAQFSVRTPVGLQCPTAALQFVSVPVMSACGHILGHQLRVPRPGETAFKQCHCAEKKAGQTANIDKGATAPLPMLAARPLALLIPNALPENYAQRPVVARLVAVPASPPVRPPSPV